MNLKVITKQVNPWSTDYKYFRDFLCLYISNVRIYGH